MITLPKSIAAIATPQFNDIVKQEIECLNIHDLPLQQAMTQSSDVSGESFSIMILNVVDELKDIKVKVAVFYSGIVSGCNCSDDPTPINENNEYCELLFIINKHTSKAKVNIV